MMCLYDGSFKPLRSCLASTDDSVNLALDAWIIVHDDIEGEDTIDKSRVHRVLAVQEFC